MDSNAVIQRFRDANVLTGIKARVARKLALSPTHVQQVAIGARASARVMEELATEVRRVDREQRKRAKAVMA